MKKGQLSEQTFSYLDSPTRKFTENNYILVVKDEEFPNSSLLSILHFEGGKVYDLNDYEMGNKVLATKNNQMLDIQPLSERFSLHQLIKISTGTIIKNDKYFEGSPYPKCLTFHTNVHELNENEIIEIFEGHVNEDSAIFELKENFLSPLFVEFYIKTNNAFFVLENELLRGPFKIKNTDSSGKLIVEKSLWKTFGRYQFNENSYIEFDANEIKRRIILPSVNELILIEKNEFLTNVELISKFELQITKNPELYSQDSLKNLIEITKKVATGVLFENVDYQNRLQSILKKAEEGFLANLNIGKILPELNVVKNEIHSLEKSKFELTSQIQKTEELINLKSSEINKLDEKLEKIKNEVANLEKFKEDELRQKKYKIEEEILILEEKKLSLDKEIEEEKINKSTEINDLDAVIKHLDQKKETLNAGIKTLQEQFTGEQKSAQQKLQDILVQNQHYNILSGREFTDIEKDDSQLFTDYQLKSVINHENFDKLKRYTEIKGEIVEILSKNNRKFDLHFIDNILISIHQNTLTLFAGLPGTGKTSLVRLLMNILSPQDRNREIAVGRGWTSQKDLIGFFNPLSKKFHSSSTNLHSLLKQLDWERTENTFLDSPLSYVLLDEANLSPMEHYWSVFYNLTDSYACEESSLKINLGDTEIIEYSNNMRFIGTINYDQTTEELSPRVIDRANIIRMDNSKSLEITRLSKIDIKHIDFTFRECIEIFELVDFSKEQNNIALDEEFELKFSDIKRKFEELKIFISPRVQIAIKQYCKVAKTVMYEQNKPLDYCIAQRLLPLIKVQGNNAKQKLKELKNMLDDNKYDISSKILTEIIQTGEEGEVFQDNFNYFLTLSHV